MLCFFRVVELLLIDNGIEMKEEREGWPGAFCFFIIRVSRAEQSQAKQGRGMMWAETLCVTVCNRYYGTFLCACEREERVWISAVSAAIWGRSMP